MSSAVTRSGNALIKLQTGQALGTTVGDERIGLPASLKREKILDPYLRCGSPSPSGS